MGTTIRITAEFSTEAIQVVRFFYHMWHGIIPLGIKDKLKIFMVLKTLKQLLKPNRNRAMSNKPTKEIKWNYYNFSLIQKKGGNEQKANRLDK